MSGQAKCNNCKTVIDIPDGYTRPFIPCPQCKRMVTITAPVSPNPNARPKATVVSGQPRSSPETLHDARRPFDSATPQPELPSQTSDALHRPSPQSQPNLTSGITAGGLPELMKANKKIAGKPCAICGKSINLGDQIHNCPKCGSVNHEACWTRSGGCIADSCSTLQRNAYTPPDIGGSTNAPFRSSDSPSEGQPDMVPCRWCKEPIMRGARKCKHCNEYQNDADRENMAVFQEAAASKDISLTGTEMLGLLCCPLIILVEGAVFVIQENPKGQRLLLYAAIMIGLHILVRTLANELK